MKYHLKGNTDVVIRVDQVSQDTVIATAYGPATITEGNYIVTSADKTQFGITEVDLKAQYRKVPQPRKNKTKSD